MISKQVRTQFTEDPSALTKSFYAVDAVAALDHQDVAALGKMARDARGPARYSLHRSASDDLHCMVILQPTGVYPQPRKHANKAKSFHLVSGEMVVVCFTDDGDVRSLHRLASDESLIVRIAPGIYHTNYSLTEQAIYHEVIAGPYDRARDDRHYAAFAPSGDDQEAGRAWLESLIATVRPGLLVPVAPRLPSVG